MENTLPRGCSIQIAKNGNKTTKRFGCLHSINDEPAVDNVVANVKRWFKNGKLHRNTVDEEGRVLPAYISKTCMKWYINGKLNRHDNLPTIVFSNGAKQWHENSLMHRYHDLPAFIKSDGTQVWYKYGQKHRDTVDENGLVKPAKIFANGDKYWFENGQLHRENDLPAIERTNGCKQWFKNGKKHRGNNLPACIFQDGNMEWWENGVFIMSATLTSQK